MASSEEKISYLDYSSIVRQTDLTNPAVTADTETNKISLNISDINEFPLLECTNDLLNSPDSAGNKSKGMILRKEGTLLTSTSSFFQDATKSQSVNALIKNSGTPAVDVFNGHTMINMEPVSKAITAEASTPSIAETPENGASNPQLSFVNDTSGNMVPGTRAESTPFVNQEPHAENSQKLNFSAVHVNDESMRMYEGTDSGEENMESDSSMVNTVTILPRLMNRSLKEVKLLENEKEIQKPETVSKITIEKVIKKNTSVAVGDIGSSEQDYQAPEKLMKKEEVGNVSDIDDDLIEAEINQSLLANQSRSLNISSQKHDELDESECRDEMKKLDTNKTDNHIYEKLRITKVYHSTVTYVIRKSHKGGGIECLGQWPSSLREVESIRETKQLTYGEHRRILSKYQRHFLKSFGNKSTGRDSEAECPDEEAANVIGITSANNKECKENSSPVKEEKQTARTKRRGKSLEPSVKCDSEKVTRSGRTSRKVETLDLKDVSEDRNTKKRQKTDTEEIVEAMRSPEETKKRKSEKQTKQTPSFQFSSLKIKIVPGTRRSATKSLDLNSAESSQKTNTEKSPDNDIVLLTTDESKPPATSTLTCKRRLVVTSSVESVEHDELTILPDNKTIVDKQCRVRIKRDEFVETKLKEFLKGQQVPAITTPETEPKRRISLRKSRQISSSSIDESEVPNLESIRNSLSATSHSDPKPSTRSDLFNKSSTATGKMEFNVGDRVFTLYEEYQTYYPSIVRQIKNNILSDKNYYKTYNCTFETPSVFTNEFLPHTTGFMQSDSMVGFDKLRADDRVKVWLESIEKFESGFFVKLDAADDESGMSPMKTRTNKQEEKFIVKMEHNGEIKKVDFNCLCLPEDTFLQVVIRRSEPAPETIRFDTREFQHLSETYTPKE